MSDIIGRLGEHGIYAKGVGSHRIPCPKCNKGGNDTALWVTVEQDSAVWYCHRCEWKGGLGGKANGYRHHDQEDEFERHQDVAEQARELWSHSTPAPIDHSYLKLKGMGPCGLKWNDKRLLLVPMRTAPHGHLWNIQTIAPGGDKRFMKGGRVKGCFHVIGHETFEEIGDQIVIAEGFATGASIWHATKKTLPVAVAFNCGNLAPVARAIRAWKPDARIVFAADDDHATDGNPGLTKARAAAELVGAAVAIPEFPDPSKRGTDFNDMEAVCGPDRGAEIIRAAMDSAPEPRQPPPEAERAQQPRRVINLADYHATRFTGPPPPIRWLVQHSIPLGVPVLLAAMGGVGKSYLTLQLCHLVTTPAIENPGIDGMIHSLNTYTRPLLGGAVVAHGKAVLITAEDSDDVIHRRLAVVDPYERRTEDLIIMALPSAGGPLPFFVQSREGVRVTDEWHMIREQLLAMPGLKLIVIDPLAAFAQVPLDADSAAASFVMSAFGQLAAETGATVLLSHHMRKSPNGRPPQTPAEAREAIRGSSAIVDGVRLAYALWQGEEAEGRKVCNDLGILPFDPARVVKGAIVKTNEKGGKPATYVRTDDGLLLDRTMDLQRSRPGRDECLNLLVEDLAAHAVEMMPLQKTGASGVYEQSECLHPTLRSIPRDHLRALCQELVDVGRIVKCRAKGSTSAVWLDVPDGPFARGDGDGEIRTGARTKRHSDAA